MTWKNFFNKIAKKHFGFWAKSRLRFFIFFRKRSLVLAKTQKGGKSKGRQIKLFQKLKW